MKTPSRRRFYGLVPGELYPITKQYARCNRKAPTDAEEVLWQHCVTGNSEDINSGANIQQGLMLSTFFALKDN